VFRFGKKFILSFNLITSTSNLIAVDQKVVETLRQTNSELTTTVTEQASEIIHIRKQLQEFCLQHSPGETLNFLLLNKLVIFKDYSIVLFSQYFFAIT
jgi:hypothetical protein